MDIDIRGRVGNINLPYQKCLIPLFEAITNSIHSIEDSQREDGYIKIYIERDTSQKTFGDHSIVSSPIKNFIVEDNGVGFTDDNFKSFNTSDSGYKATKGGKGIGRLSWLKAFKQAEVESTYQANGKTQKRHFEFCLTEKGINNHVDNVVENQGCKTTVKLLDFDEKYRKECPITLPNFWTSP